MQELLDENLANEELIETLNKSTVYTQWGKKANEFHMNCLNWLIKII